MLNHDLCHLRKTTGSILRIDHTYKFTKCLGAYDIAKQTQNPLWICF